MKLNFSGKRGVSAVIGYVLLISVVIVMSVIVYQWVRTYIPRENLECPDGASLMIENYEYDCAIPGSENLSLDLRNNGLFDVDGYFIHVTNEEGRELATIDISSYTSLGELGSMVRFPNNDPLSPGDGQRHIFDFSETGVGQIYKVQIVPARQEKIEGRFRLASCNSAKIEEDILCTSS